MEEASRKGSPAWSSQVYFPWFAQCCLCFLWFSDRSTGLCKCLIFISFPRHRLRLELALPLNPSQGSIAEPRYLPSQPPTLSLFSPQCLSQCTPHVFSQLILYWSATMCKNAIKNLAQQSTIFTSCFVTVHCTTPSEVMWLTTMPVFCTFLICGPRVGARGLEST